MDSFSKWGFTINGRHVEGSVLLLPSASFLFRVSRLELLTPRSLHVLKLLKDVELLLIGGGSRPGRLPADAQRWLALHSFATEVQSTRTACATFNFMAQEQRPVVSILFPFQSDAKNS